MSLPATLALTSPFIVIMICTVAYKVINVLTEYISICFKMSGKYMYLTL